jgi:hypothetical protein
VVDIGAMELSKGLTHARTKSVASNSDLWGAK